MNSTSEFYRRICYMTIAHIIKINGYESIQSSALDTLVEIFIKYIEKIGISSNEIAEFSGRVQPNVDDILIVLRDMMPIEITINDLKTAHQKAKIPFPHDIPEKPSLSLTNSESSNIGLNSHGEDNELKKSKQNTYYSNHHLPYFAPPLPAKHTYCKEASDIIKRETNPKKIRHKLLLQKRKLQESLNHLYDDNHISDISLTIEKELYNKKIILPKKKKKFLSDSLTDAVPTNSTNTVSSDLRGSNENKTLVMNNTIELLGKEDRILAGTFHEGDSD